MTHPKILPGLFHLSAKVGGKNVFVQSKLIREVVQVVFTCLSSVGKGFKQTASLDTFAVWFLKHPMTQRHPQNCQNKIKFKLLKKKKCGGTPWSKAGVTKSNENRRASQLPVTERDQSIITPHYAMERNGTRI